MKLFTFLFVLIPLGKVWIHLLYINNPIVSGRELSLYVYISGIWKKKDKRCTSWNYLIIPIFLQTSWISNFSDILHHHHVALVARISLTLSRHSSLSFIALGRSSGQHPVFSHSCWMYVRAGRPAFARPCVGVHKSTSLMSSSLLLRQCPACLVHLTWIVFVIGGSWPYSWCLVGCCRQDLFKIACSILV